ncbi:MAG TPA: adenosylcobinamide-GDP ribazoletransferase [Gammaproteobacteria bacterium]
MIAKPFLLAVQFLTRFPLPSLRDIAPHDVGRSMLYYPLVGALIGALLFALDHLLVEAAPLLRAALLVVAWVVITGGLHLDGVADMADAWVGGHGERERTLALMKDPACGPMGVLALLLLLLLKVAALESLAGHAAPLLIVAPLLARTALLLLFLTTPYVRRGGLGETLAQQLPRRVGWLVVVAVPGGVLLLVPHIWGVVVMVGIVFLLFRQRLLQRLGGTTGDTAGALLEVCEATILLAAALL